jgi:hyperosmotically inducible protein
MRNFLIAVACIIFIATTYGCTASPKVTGEEEFVRSFAGDKKIMSTILKKFLADRLVNDLDITPRCYNGYAYIVGEYESEQQKIRAIEIAESVEGVKSLETYLILRKNDDSCEKGDNLRITAAVKTKITEDKRIWSKNLSIVTAQCTVVLMGFVQKEREIQRAIAHAESVEGVKGVKSYLKAIQ